MESVGIELRNVNKYYFVSKKHWKTLMTIFKKSYATTNEVVWALKDVTLVIKKGEAIGIIGENGSGKSTLLSVMARVTPPSSGYVRTFGRTTALLELGVGFNPQATGRENIYLYGAALGLSPRELKERVTDILNFAELGDFIDRPLRTYSTGMYVRLAFATAVAIDPDILLIDEALAVGDTRFQHKCIRKVEEMLSKQKTLVIASHDLQLLLNLCNKIIWMRNGKVEAFGPPKDVIKSYEKYLFYKDQYETNAQRRDVPFGNNKARIIALDASINGKRRKVISPRDLLSIKMSVEAVGDIQRPIVGILIRSMTGLAIFSLNTYVYDVHLPPLKKGQGLYCTFSFRWPPIAPGSYTVSAAVADGTQEEHEVCCWVDDLVILHAINSSPPLALLHPDDLEITWTFSNLSNERAL